MENVCVMSFGRARHPRDATSRLVAAARLSRRERGSADDSYGLRAAIAVAVMQHAGRLRSTLREAELLLSDVDSYDAVMDLLEDIQNVASHELEGYQTAQQVRAELGPRSLVAWQSLRQFWLDVETWGRGRDDVPTGRLTAQQIKGINSPDLYRMVVTDLRRVGPDRYVGLGQVVMYERHGPGGLPNFSHIDAVL